MADYNIEKIRQKLEKNLSASRYQHTLGVAYTSACLAMRFGADARKALIAGLLHDCAKEYKEKELLKMAPEAGIIFTEEELNAPQVLHAVLGPYVAGKKYSIEDPEILSAIRWHTTGKEDMTLLEQIVFTADYIEPNRDKAPDLPEVRPLAFSDLKLCMLKITEHTLDYLDSKGVKADSNTKNCYEWLKKEKESEHDHK
ncbi:MAG: bis(5'-nucleosyl)-tetraphosphatase (symmetrical) YqeK [Stomatobaculum sp.]|nr:bis(5'-nucleosyl)-tetraphosphatase (symmetrical) YqeK [Stomatobaculum sp.]